MEAQRDRDNSLGTESADPGFGDTAVKILGGALMSGSRQGHDESTPPETGSIVGDRYLLQNWVRAGRLGDVYQAVDQQLDKSGQGNHRVIIELFDLHQGQSDLGEQFASRFIGLLAVSHPDIARIFDFGIDGTTVFFTTEILEGASLRTVLDGGSTDFFTENEVLGVLGSIVDALRHIHAKGIVHGDLKPESIFITDNYEVRIADLASAVLKQALDSRLAAQNGNSKVLKPVDDVFGLAAIAYEMLSNEHPYQGMSHRQAQQKNLELHRIKGVPRARWKALSQALRPQAGKGTPSIDEFASQFGIVGTESIREAEPTKQKNQKKQKKHRHLVLPLILVAVAAAAITLIRANDLAVGELFSDFRDRASSALDSILPSSAPVADVAVIADEIADAQEQPVQNDNTVSENMAQTELSTAPMPTQTPVVDDASTILAPPQPDVTDIPAPQTEMTRTEPSPASNDYVAVTEDIAIPESMIGANDVADIEPLRISFEQDIVTAYENEGMASIAVRRQGAVGEEVSVIWWTANNSAIADQDYADLGVRMEKLSAGQASMTIYVPLIIDSQREPRESFYVYVGSALAPKDLSDRIEVIVIDSRY